MGGSIDLSGRLHTNIRTPSLAITTLHFRTTKSVRLEEPERKKGKKKVIKDLSGNLNIVLL